MLLGIISRISICSLVVNKSLSPLIVELSANFGKEILSKWNAAITLENACNNTNNNHNENSVSEKVDIQTQLARITESKSEAYRASTKAAAERHEKD